MTTLTCAPARFAVFSGIRVREHIEFADGIDSPARTRSTPPGVTPELARSHVLDAVQQEQIFKLVRRPATENVFPSLVLVLGLFSALKLMALGLRAIRSSKLRPFRGKSLIVVRSSYHTRNRCGRDIYDRNCLPSYRISVDTGLGNKECEV